LASPEPIADLAHRIDREQRAQHVQEEDALRNSLAGFRVGSVPYLNAVPLTYGLEEQIRFAPPSQLAKDLQADRLDAALVSVTEVLLNDRYDVLDGIAVASLGEVKSVLLAHRQPLDQMQVVYCDTASLTSRYLLEILLAEKGIKPRFEPLPEDPNAFPDYFLLIGDQALEFTVRNPDFPVWDLGSAWYEWTGLPFVYAVWALRRDTETAKLRPALRQAKSFGLEILDHIIRTTRQDLPLALRQDYLGWHIHFHIGSDERRALDRFRGLMDQHGLGPTYPPRFVV